MFKRFSSPARAAAVTAVALLALAAAPAVSPAAVIYDFRTDQSNYDVAPNGSATILVYLRETVTGGSTSLLGPEGGLFSAGVAAAQTTAPSSPATLTAAARDLAFDDTGTAVMSVTATLARFTEAVSSGGAPSTDLGGGVREVPLGSFTVHGGSIPLQSTTFTVRDYDNYGSSEDTLTALTATVLDVPNGTSPSAVAFTVTVTAPVPEPAAMGLLLLAAPLLARRRR